MIFVNLRNFLKLQKFLIYFYTLVYFIFINGSNYLSICHLYIFNVNKFFLQIAKCLYCTNIKHNFWKHQSWFFNILFFTLYANIFILRKKKKQIFINKMNALFITFWLMLFLCKFFIINCLFWGKAPIFETHPFVQK